MWKYEKNINHLYGLDFIKKETYLPSYQDITWLDSFHIASTGWWDYIAVNKRQIICIARHPGKYS